MNRKEAAMEILKSLEKASADVWDVAKVPFGIGAAGSKTMLGFAGLNKRRATQAVGAAGSAYLGGGLDKAVGAVQSGATSKDMGSLAGNLGGTMAANHLTNALVKNPVANILAKPVIGTLARKGGRFLAREGKNYATGNY